MGYPESVDDRFGKVFLCIDGASIRSRNAEKLESKPNLLGFSPGTLALKERSRNAE